MKTKKTKLLPEIIFVMKVIWQEDKLLLLLVASCILLSVLASLLSVYYPAAVVGVIERGGNPVFLLLLALGAIVLFAAHQAAAEGRGMRQLFICRSTLYRVFLRRMEKDYADTESIEGQEEYSRAHQVCLWGNDFRLLLEGIIDLFVCVITFFLYSGFLLALEPLLVVLLLVLSCLNYYMLRRSNLAYGKLQDSQAGENRRFFYLINAATNIKAGKDMRLYRLSETVQGLMDKSLDRIGEMQGRYFSKVGQAQAFEGVTAYLRNGIVLLYLAVLAADGRMSVSGFLIYFGIITQISGFMTVLVRSYSTLVAGCSGIEHVEQYLSPGSAAAGCTLVKENADDAKEYGTVPEVEFKDVSFAYDGKNEVIHGLSFSIKKGEKIGLVGMNGAGKTTIVKLLCGLYAPQSGEIRVQGRTCDTERNLELKDKMAVVFQDALILPYTVAENVSLKPLQETDEEWVRRALEQAGLMETVDKHKDSIHAQMTKAVSKDGLVFSGGQLQKLFMARMLYREDAFVWILDEPTAALDPIAENEIYQSFQENGRGKTCIYISHRLASTRFLDRILLLENGRIIESGSHEELMRKNGRYAQLYQIQSQYYQKGETV